MRYAIRGGSDLGVKHVGRRSRSGHRDNDRDTYRGNERKRNAAWLGIAYGAHVGSGDDIAVDLKVHIRLEFVFPVSLKLNCPGETIGVLKYASSACFNKFSS